MVRSRQPWLHELTTILKAPTTVLSAADGQVRPDGAQGIFHADVRVLSCAELRVDGVLPHGVAGGALDASAARFVALARSLGDAGLDPTVRIERLRRVSEGVVTEEIRLLSSAREEITTSVTLDLAADLAGIDSIKSGVPGDPIAFCAAGEGVDTALLQWNGGQGQGRLQADGDGVKAFADSRGARVQWPVRLSPGQTCTLNWTLSATVSEAPVIGNSSAAPWSDVRLSCDDRRLTVLATQSLADLTALLMASADAPGEAFAAAGSPWFFTLFGRDSIWAARLMLPFGWELAASTLRALAARQGRRVDDETMEAPGKILHELRKSASVYATGSEQGTFELPPLYYGSIDSTPLWVCLLHDAWRAGMPDGEVRALLPGLEAALAWMPAHGDVDGDGFLEYHDVTGRGLANQGWKDSDDSIRFADGRRAQTPVALCEVQGYAYEAAVHGADLLDAFGRPGGAEARAWAADLRARFRECFWVSDTDGPFPALALDRFKRPVDSVTSNIGHLLGTGLLDEAETALVLDRLTGPGLDSGFGLRTMSAHHIGFSPLSYHRGSVWPHDTAIVVRAMTVAGHPDRALPLIEGLLAAGAHFDGRLPELYSGDSRAVYPWPIPYPASCRPQAWAAAAIGAVVQALLGLDTDVPNGTIRLRPIPLGPVGAFRVEGLPAGRGNRIVVDVTAGGEVTVFGDTDLELLITPAPQQG